MFSAYFLFQPKDENSIFVRRVHTSLQTCIDTWEFSGAKVTVTKLWKNWWASSFTIFLNLCVQEHDLNIDSYVDGGSVMLWGILLNGLGPLGGKRHSTQKKNTFLGDLFQVRCKLSSPKSLSELIDGISFGRALFIPPSTSWEMCRNCVAVCQSPKPC